MTASSASAEPRAACPRLDELPGRDLPGGLRVAEARTRPARMKGLARLDAMPGQLALHLPRCRSVHTFTMRFPLDLIWLSGDGRAGARRPRGRTAPPEVLLPGPLGRGGERRHRRRVRRRVERAPRAPLSPRASPQSGRGGMRVTGGTRVRSMGSWPIEGDVRRDGVVNRGLRGRGAIAARGGSLSHRDRAGDRRSPALPGTFRWTELPRDLDTRGGRRYGFARPTVHEGEQGGNDRPAVKVVGPHDADEGFLGSIGVRFMIDGLDAAERSRSSSIRCRARARRAAAPPHARGRVELRARGPLGALLGDDIVEAGPGDLVYKPRNQWHTFWNAGDEPCRILEIISPAGFERFFRSSPTWAA